jgi:hypothetical protein
MEVEIKSCKIKQEDLLLGDWSDIVRKYTHVSFWYRKLLIQRQTVTCNFQGLGEKHSSKEGSKKEKSRGKVKKGQASIKNELK